MRLIAIALILFSTTAYADYVLGTPRVIDGDTSAFGDDRLFAAE